LLKHIFALSDEEVCERWVYDPYFQYFTGEEFFQHVFPHERSDLSHWRKRLGEKLEVTQIAQSLPELPPKLFRADIANVGTFGCCARAPSGHDAAAPPSAASNSRRPMVSRSAKSEW
jgi:hypothetical protein